MNNTIKYIKELTSIPSPTGYTNNIMDYVYNKVENLGFKVERLNKGSILVSVMGIDNTKSRILSAHLDTLGAMVRAIKPNGRLKLELVGGFSYNSIEGENCLIHLSDENKVYSGTILMHQSSVHVYSDARSASRDQNNMEVRIDEKVFTKKDTENLGIKVGDFISFNPRTEITENGFIKSRHLDDKVSAAILLDILENISNNKIEIPFTTHFYFTTYEEVGIGANSSIPKNTVEYIAVDMGAIGDDQTSDEYTVSICAKDSSGPYNYDLRRHLVNIAKENNIEYRVDIYPHYGSDASSAMRAGAEVKHGLLGAGIESSHSYERTHIDSVKATQDLLFEYILSDLC